MKLTWLWMVGVFFGSSLAYAQLEPERAPLSKEDFCSSYTQKDYFRSLALNPRNHLAERNQGGLLNSGVCWWHALFQRASLYLVVFLPDEPRPTDREAEKMIHAIAARSRVVEIPGYRDLWEFSKAYWPMIQAKLESWQLKDGFLKFAWIWGLWGSSTSTPSKIEKKLNEFYHWVETEGQIEWAMWQVPGIATHGVLFNQVQILPQNIRVSYLDNNFVGSLYNVTYIKGEKTINGAYGPFVPYSGRRSDLRYFKEAAEEYCASSRERSFLPDDVLDEPLYNGIE